jgi:putative FmdB family regulatory protein
MPTYEYRCPDGHEFEEFVRTISAAQAELKCPVCGKTAARQMSGGSALLFKGSGFYITDYGKDGKKDQRRASGTESKGTTSTGGTSEAKSDSSGGEKSEKSERSEKSEKSEKKEPKGTSKKDE